MIDHQEMAKQLRLPEGENAKLITDFMAKGNRSMYDFTFEHLQLKSYSDVLEIGPANGFFVKDLFAINESINYTGLDLSQDMINEATTLNSVLIEKGRAKFICGDVGDLPFAENSFDLIFSVNTLYFWTDLSKGMNELKRVLKPNGKLVLVIRSKETMLNMPFTQYGFQLYSKIELEKLFSDNGFHNRTISTKNEVLTLPSGIVAHLETFCAIAEKS